ncbi:MAG: DNA cytosine methyltransferase [Desulfomonile sp.]
MTKTPAITHYELQPTFIDLFCGAGGLSIGFQEAGFKCVCAIDNNEPAIATYQRNFQDHIKQDDITENISLPNADVIIGGPPCQGFSSAGMRRADDKRNSLVRVFSELVARQRPKAFVFENVEGFLTSSNGDRVFDLLGPLIQVGYRIHLHKINAANYGVPQHRKRVLAIGGLGWNPTFTEPTHMAFGAPGASKAYRHLPPCPTLAGALDGLPPPTEKPPGIPQGHYTRPLSEKDSERVRLLRPGQIMRDLPDELWHNSYRRRAYRRVMDGTPTECRGGAPFGLRRLYSDQPSKAITSGAISEFVHPTENRFLTLRECARIQTFPDSFVFVGNMAESILQIGNAIPPRLAEAVASRLRIDLSSSLVGTYSQGKLLTFVPTVSFGKSPALKALCVRVEDKYLTEFPYIEKEQLKLWG